jgi:hypothetical protein
LCQETTLLVDSAPRRVDSEPAAGGWFTLVYQAPLADAAAIRL